MQEYNSCYSLFKKISKSELKKFNAITFICIGSGGFEKSFLSYCAQKGIEFDVIIVMDEKFLYPMGPENHPRFAEVDLSVLEFTDKLMLNMNGFTEKMVICEKIADAKDLEENTYSHLKFLHVGFNPQLDEFERPISLSMIGWIVFKKQLDGSGWTIWILDGGLSLKNYAIDKL